MALSEFSEKFVLSLGPRLKPAFVFAVAVKGMSPGWKECRERFEGALLAWATQTRWRGFLSVFKERARDFIGLLLGRAELAAIVFDPSQPDRFRSSEPDPDTSAES